MRKVGILANMLRITARINIGDNNGDLRLITSPQAGMVGSSTLLEVKGHHTQIQRPFILGRSRLGGGDCYTKKANFYIGKTVADSNGNFPRYSTTSDLGYTLNIDGTNLTKLTIVFNKRDNEYPRSIIVDGVTVYDDDPTWAVALGAGEPFGSVMQHTIKIQNWNTPNKPMVISSIYADLSIDIDESNLLDFERTILSKDNYAQPSYGIISNTGSLSFIDKDTEVADIIAQQLINSNNTITVNLENTKTGITEQIAQFNTEKWRYNIAQSIVDITLKDDLEEWQDINVPVINYVPTISTSQTAEWLYKQLYAQTPAKFDMLSFDELDEQTKAVLSGTTIQYPLIESDNLWAQWNKLCQLCFLNIYKNGKGRTICKYSGE